MMTRTTAAGYLKHFRRSYGLTLAKVASFMLTSTSISNSVPGTLFRAEMTRKDIFLSLTGIWVINNIREHIVNGWISLSEKTNVYGWKSIIGPQEFS